MTKDKKDTIVQMKNHRTDRYLKIDKTKKKIICQKKMKGPYKGIPVIDGISTNHTSIEKKTLGTLTVSQCCGSPVYVSTRNDFTKIDKDDQDSWLMTIEFICHKCGKECLVKEIPEVELGKKKFSIIFWVRSLLGC